MVSERPLVIVSNRGPVSFVEADDGSLVAKRGGGGLVTALGPAVAGSGATWIAAALSDADRRAAARGTVDAGGYRVRLLEVDPDDQRASYDVIANGSLWFLHHGLWDAPRRPRFDRVWHRAWASYVAVNAAFADAVADEAPEGATVLVQDYHLALVAEGLTERRPDLALVWFGHTPWCSAEELRVLPDVAAERLLRAMSGFVACGFHASRWEAGFLSCFAAGGVTPPATFVAPATADLDDLRRVAASEACRAAHDALEGQVGDRALLVRVDRIELSKNLLRGFLAYEDLLREHPEWRERVVFVAYAYPSREGLAEYLAYRSEVEGLIRRINTTWSTPTWTPILYDSTDDFPRSVAALRRADVVLVNPVRDGLNLVAAEAALVNERDGVLVLSREAGIAESMTTGALLVNPFDVAATADALHRALALDPAERAALADEARRLAASRSPADWVADQVAAAGR